MQKRKIDWPIVLFIFIYQGLVLALAPFYFYYASPSWGLVVVAIFLYIATGISITAGFHRFYAHRAYKANKIVEAVLLFWGTVAGQGSALRWTNDHRLHHMYVDTDKDPYSIKKGFWYAHILWLVRKREPINRKVVADLFKNRLVVFQDKHYLVLFFSANFLAAAATGLLFNDYLGAFFLAWWVRLFVLHHTTWFINSLAHTWGSKSYSKEFSAVDNYLISLLTFGEGYHNYHHCFATDYRNGIKWYHFDPSKWLIWSLSKAGLTENLTRMDKFKIRKHVIKKDKDLLLSRIQEISHAKMEVLEHKIHELAERIVSGIAHLQALKDEYRKSKTAKAGADVLKQLRLEMRQLKRNLYQDWKRWRRLFKSTMKLKPVSGMA